MALVQEQRIEKAKVKKPIICLVGSVKQEDDWRMWVKVLTIRGYVVLEAGLYGTVGESITQETWDLVELVHHKKIEISDVVGVIRKRDGTVGENT